MKVIKHQLFIAAALLTGVAIGFFAGDHAPAAKPEEAERSVRKAGVVADKGEEATIVALRRRVADLEKLLAEKDGQSEVAISNAVAVATAARPPEPPRGNWRERLEEMKKNDPERYMQTTNRIAQWRRHQAERAQSTLGFLSSVDTSRMGNRAKRTHEALQELIARREEISEQLHQEDISDEDRGQLMEELHQTHRELMRLNGEERKNLFDETARNLGFEGQDVHDFTTAILEVIDATDGGRGPGRRSGPRGPGGPGGR